MVWKECTHSARPLPGGNPMAVSPCSLFFSIPLGKVAPPSRRCGTSKGCGWYRLCPPRLQYDRFELEVHTYYWSVSTGVRLTRVSRRSHHNRNTTRFTPTMLRHFSTSWAK